MQYIYNATMPKQKRKTATMTLRIEPKVKEIAELAAQRARRSVANLIEVLVLAHGKQVGIEPTSEADRSEKGEKENVE